MVAADPNQVMASTVASTLLGVVVDRADRIANRGRNSRIYRIRSGGQSFALKQYPSRQDDPRDRLQAEADALRLMEHSHIDCVPRVVAMDRQESWLLITWIEGSPVDNADEGDIDAADQFLSAVHTLRDTPEAQCLPLAAEACLSGAEIERQIRQRLGRLNTRRTSDQELGMFLESSFIPALDRVLQRVASKISAIGIAYDAVLPRTVQSLIPADFGFHNSLRQPDGSLVFLDFEYFGWDDPVKLAADFLLHPGMTLAPAARGRFRLAAERRHAHDLFFTNRLDALLPLFGLRWVLILLNEFLPERWESRVKAGAAASWTEEKRRQLIQARELLGHISSATEGHPGDAF